MWKIYIRAKTDHRNKRRVSKDTEELGLDIIRDVVMAAIKEMKNNKTEGIDSIPPEVFKCLGRRQ